MKTNYDVIAAMRMTEGQDGFDQRAISKMTVKQLLLIGAKLAMIRDASRSEERRQKLLTAVHALAALRDDFQTGALDTAIKNAERAPLLIAEVELARESVGCVVAAATDPSQAFWLVGSSGKGIDVSAVVKK